MASGSWPGIASPYQTLPTGWPSISSGPATPVTEMPTLAPSARRAPTAISFAASSVTTRGAVTPRIERFTSVAYDATAPRNTRLAPGTLARRAPMNPPVSDSPTPSVHPRASHRPSTVDSIVSSSTANTRSPSTLRSSTSSASSSAAASASVAAFAVMRT